MAAANTDLLKKYKSLFSTTLSTGIGTGTGDTITPATVTGLPTDTAIILTLDRVDSSGVATPSKLERILGVVSGGNLTSYVRAKDSTTEQAHSSGAVIEMVWNAQDWNDMVDWGLQDHAQLGYHKSLTDTNGNEWIKQTATASAVNEITVANAATGNAPTISATGDDTNIDLSVTGKGTGGIKLGTGTVAVTDVLDEDTMSSDSDTKLVTQQSIKAYVDAQIASVGSSNLSLFNNLLINGNMDVWQRLDNTSAFTAATRVVNNDDTYLMDRWVLVSDGNDIVDVTRSTDKPDGSTYSAKFDVQTEQEFGIVQIVESVDSKKLDNKTVSLSFAAKSESGEITTIRAAVLTWGSTADSVTSDVVATWGTTPTWATNWTAENTPGDITITDSWATYSIENISIDTATVNNIAVVIWTPNAESVGDTLYLSQIQLNQGATANTFMPRSWDDEYRRCLRFYEQSWDYGAAQNNSEVWHVSNTNGYVGARPRHPKRKNLTTSEISFYNGSTANEIRNTNTGGTLSMTPEGVGANSDNIITVYDLGVFTANTAYDYNWIINTEL